MADHKSLERWGRDKAKARYNVDKRDTLGPDVEIQKNQAPESKHSPNYDNDVPAKSWLITNGEKKTSFDKKRSG